MSQPEILDENDIERQRRREREQEIASALITENAIIALAQNCHHLKELDLKRWNLLITPNAIRELAAGCKYLTKLNLNSLHELTDDEIALLASGCYHLESLDLSFCEQITAAAIVALARNCPYLKNLTLCRCNNIANIETIRDLPILQELEQLDLSSCQTIHVGWISALAQKCPNLKEIDLTNSNITDEEIRAIATYCPKLEKCTLGNYLGGAAITDNAIVTIVTNCRNLDSLKLIGCDNLENAALIRKLPELPELEKIELRYCDTISNAWISALFSKCPNLKELNFCECNISDEGMRAIATYCKKLEKINIYNCRNITNDGITALLPLFSAQTKELIRGCPNLTHIAIDRFNITDAVAFDLAKSFPHLMILALDYGVQLTDRTIQAFMENCTELRQVRLGYSDIKREDIRERMRQNAERYKWRRVQALLLCASLDKLEPHGADPE